MGKARNLLFTALVGIGGLVLGLGHLGVGLAQGPVPVSTPERAISLNLPYTSFVLSRGQEVTMDAEVVNLGRLPERVRLKSSPIPEGWEVGFQSRFPRFEVSGVYVPGGKSQEIQFRLKVPEDAQSGEYRVTVTAESEDGRLRSTQELLIRVKEKEETTPEGKGLKVESRYPVLSGPSGSRFEFTLDLENQTEEDRTFDLIARPPPGWQHRFKPEFEEKQISSISLKKGERRGVAIELTTPPRAKPGEYPVPVTVRSGNLEKGVELKVNITGTYKLRVGTPTGLLNTKATAGKETTVTLLMLNEGTAPLQNISFISSKPENWRVEFDPERVDTLAPEEVREVNVKITPPAKAIPGDYSVTLTVTSPQTFQDLNLRVTVSTPTIWGWVGVGIVVVVVGGLAGLFVRLGRR